MKVSKTKKTKAANNDEWEFFESTNKKKIKARARSVALTEKVDCRGWFTFG